MVVFLAPKMHVVALLFDGVGTFLYSCTDFVSFVSGLGKSL